MDDCRKLLIKTLLGFFVAICAFSGVATCIILYHDKTEKEYLQNNYETVTVIKGDAVMTMEEFEDEFGSYENYDIVIDKDTDCVFIYNPGERGFRGAAW